MLQQVKTYFFCYLVVGAFWSPLAVFIPERLDVAKENVLVEDLFQALPNEVTEKTKKKVLFAAPMVGKPLHVPLRQIIAIARQHHITWENGVDLPSVVMIFRKVKTIEEKDLKELVHQKIPEEHKGSDILLHTKQITIPQDINLEALQFSGFLFDRASGHFSIQVGYEDQGKIHVQKLRGILSHNIQLPVLRELVAPGALIGAEHIEWIPYARQKLNAAHILNVEDLIGHTPSHPLQIGVPLRSHDIKKPLLIKKGELVTITYTGDKLKITLKAKALENGILGEMINVQGHDHKKVISVMVTGRNRAEANP